MTPAIDLKTLAADAYQLRDWINARRQHIHAHPELSFNEEKTSLYVRNELRALGLNPSDPLAGKHGFYVDLKSPMNPEKFVLLRADMDALPIQEDNDIPFRSQTPGVGHLCGHDVHTSMLLGAAALLRDRINQLPISVRMVFQHAEEVCPGGARDFVEAGLAEPAIGCFGIHVSPRVTSGKIGLRAGETMACVGTLQATIIGRGGHGAAPHETVDPVPAAAAAILNLQQIVSRRIAPVEPAVVSVTMINAGTATNVIPNQVTFAGTFRSFNMETIPLIEEMIRQIITDTARSYGCTADVVAFHSYPPVINAPQATEASIAAIEGLFGPIHEEIPKSMGAEDFAYFAQERPSAFVFLGVLPEGETFYPLHHPKFLPDDSTFWRGSALLAAMPFVAPNYLK